jgi:trehalose/maltose transport system substrate-binding protein
MADRRRMGCCLQSRDAGFAGSSTVCSWPLGAIAAAIASLGLAFLALEGCSRQSAQPGVTLTLVEQSPGLDEALLDSRSREFEAFRRETGVSVQSLPTPESADDQLLLWEKLLDSHASTPDVYSIDCIWPGILAEHLIDLEPFMASQLREFVPALVSNYTVNRAVVAAPSRTSTGLLFYRKDLLEKYGYRAPPATWDELERMAARIQAAERAQGNRDFWGYVWEGGGGEPLLCNALEWQASEGGGTIIESDGSVSVNNPRAVAAWERAARWVGTISPPAVTHYQEWDAENVWLSGNAAFMRNWPNAYLGSSSEGSKVRARFDATLLPAGRAGHWGTVGGSSYGVSRYSPHRQEAIALVRYLTSRGVQMSRAYLNDGFPIYPELYRDPSLLAASPYLRQIAGNEHFAVRPAAVCGKNYQKVSQAYAEAVHAVLTHGKTGPAAARELEIALVGITGHGPR